MPNTLTTLLKLPRTSALLLALVPLLAVAQIDLSAFRSSTPEFLPVEEAYQLEVEQSDPQTLRLYWQITEGYYLYQHQFKVTLEDSGGAVGTALKFPQAKQKVDEFFGDVQVYYQSADLSLTTERMFGTAKLAATSQGCADAGLCYPPNTEIFTIDGATGLVTIGEPPSLTAASAQTNGKAGVKNAPATESAQAEEPLGTTLLSALLFAFLGGIILNTMPCVFPILSLKVLSFATGDPAKHHRHTWWYLVGVIVSFVSIAGALIALQNAGQLIGWGFQLQSPGFVIGLAYLFTAMGLSLSGVVHFGSGLMNLGGTLAGQGGSKGSFFTGVLAVLVASPCTAPFMGSALGFALTQPAVIALSVFVALGAGMAAPMVLLSYSSTARQLLPKPGQWMETLKELLAFPLYATAVWLLWVAGKQAGIDTMASALGGLIFLALGLYLYRGSLTRRVIAIAFIGIALAMGGYRGPTNNNGSIATRHEGTINWSTDTLSKLRTEGIPVFVDVTADWCITCLANEKAVLFTDRARAAFDDSGVTYMVADWTNYDDDIGAFVKSHGRNGIPLYVMYPADPNQKPFLLPQLLTPSILEDALTRASASSALSR